MVWWRIENEIQKCVGFRRTVLATSHDATSLSEKKRGFTVRIDDVRSKQPGPTSVTATARPLWGAETRRLDSDERFPAGAGVQAAAGLAHAARRRAAGARKAATRVAAAAVDMLGVYRGCAGIA